MGESVKKGGGTKEGHKNREMGVGWQGRDEVRACGSRTGVQCDPCPAAWDVRHPKLGKTSAGLRGWSLTCAKSTPAERGGRAAALLRDGGICTFPASEHLPPLQLEFLCLEIPPWESCSLQTPLLRLGSIDQQTAGNYGQGEKSSP